MHKKSPYIDFDAVEQSDGSWLHNDGSVCWYNEDGDIHREDGPAIKYYGSGDVGWCLNNRIYTFAEWLIELNKTDECKMMLRLQYA